VKLDSSEYFKLTSFFVVVPTLDEEAPEFVLTKLGTNVLVIDSWVHCTRLLQNSCLRILKRSEFLNIFLIDRGKIIT